MNLKFACIKVFRENRKIIIESTIKAALFSAFLWVPLYLYLNMGSIDIWTCKDVEIKDESLSFATHTIPRCESRHYSANGYHIEKYMVNAINNMQREKQRYAGIKKEIQKEKDRQASERNNQQ